MAVDMRAKLHAFFLYLSHLGERENLKASGISEYRPMPVHELVEPAEVMYHLVARSQVKMISVAKFHLSSYGLQIRR